MRIFIRERGDLNIRSRGPTARSRPPSFTLSPLQMTVEVDHSTRDTRRRTAPRGVADGLQVGFPDFITPAEINPKTGTGTFCTNVTISSDGGNVAVGQARISSNPTAVLDRCLMLRAARSTKESLLPKEGSSPRRSTSSRSTEKVRISESSIE
jgi:hypothetical protein